MVPSVISYVTTSSATSDDEELLWCQLNRYWRHRTLPRRKLEVSTRRQIWNRDNSWCSVKFFYGTYSKNTKLEKDKPRIILLKPICLRHSCEYISAFTCIAGISSPVGNLLLCSASSCGLSVTFDRFQSEFDEWVMVQWSAHWPSLWTAVSQINKSWFRNHAPTHQAICHDWHILPCCLWLVTCSQISSIKYFS